ncbi:MAG: hypothetical protein JWQ27_702 [Ferruginibacter sp.]|nr:hypothetical protein [Ferruginibacter sp.]
MLPYFFSRIFLHARKKKLPCLFKLFYEKNRCSCRDDLYGIFIQL